MNRSAYFTAGFAIKALSRFSKADIVIHGEDNLLGGPKIFVINHFTRIETLILPSYIYNLTDKPVWSLADSSLFKGGLETFFNLVGVVSTKDPKRDEMIVRSLLTGKANWIIFPEGSMVKTKKIMARGKFMVTHSGGINEPHTGAAALALRTELFRQYLLGQSADNNAGIQVALNALDIENIDDIQRHPTTIVPVNLTYYPIRAMENIASNLAAKLVKDISERMVEEIMTEGTMLLSGVDLDIRFGKPIQVKDFIEPEWLEEDMGRDGIKDYFLTPALKKKMRHPAYTVMQQYMHDIYAMTTVNHEHLYASFLRTLPFKRIRETDFKRRVFYTASLISDREHRAYEFFLHKSLKENQIHLLTDDRYGKYKNFLQLAEDKGVVKKDGDYLVRDHSKLSLDISFHKGRIDNPIEIMANEVEPLTRLQKLIRSLSWQPTFLLNLLLLRYLIKKEQVSYERACTLHVSPLENNSATLGRPFLLPALSRKKGVVLVHSYLAVPEEVRLLAGYLRRQGYWVYAPRLPGHGTTAEDLSNRKYQEWIDAVEHGFALMNIICERVVVGGVAVGGNLALDLAARVESIAGVFAVCPPFTLKNYSTNFMPTVDVWDRMLNRMKGAGEKQFLDFAHGNLHVNYMKNPVAGVHQIGEFLESVADKYRAIKQPALLIQADKNPVVDPAGAKKIYDELESEKKEYSLMSFDRHVLVEGPRAGMVHREIASFIKMV